MAEITEKNRFFRTRSGKSYLSVTIFSGFALVALALALTGCNKKDGGAADTEILIGEYGSLTGATATFGINTRNGVDMAIEEINAAGGVLGKKLKVIVEDDQGKPEEAQTVVTKLINKDRVIAVLGEVASSNSLAGAPVCQQNKIPMITPASTNPKVTEVGDYIFRICFIDPFQGQVMAKFAANSLKLKNVAILTDIKSDYSVGLAKFFKEEFTKTGTIVAEESYSQGDKDFTAQLTSLKSKKPEAIFLPGYYTEVGLIARQAKKLGITAVLLGGDGWDSSKLWEIGGEALNGTYFSNHYSIDDPSPEIVKFNTAYKARFNAETPDAMAALAYDATYILVDAIKRGNSTAPDSIRDALKATKDFKGITGTITLDAQRNALKPAVVLEVRDGKYLFKEKVSP